MIQAVVHFVFAADRARAVDGELIRVAASARRGVRTGAKIVAEPTSTSQPGVGECVLITDSGGNTTGIMVLSGSDD